MIIYNMIDILFYRIAFEEKKKKDEKYYTRSYPCGFYHQVGANDHRVWKVKAPQICLINGHIRVKMENFDTYKRMKNW